MSLHQETVALDPSRKYEIIGMHSMSGANRTVHERKVNVCPIVCSGDDVVPRAVGQPMLEMTADQAEAFGRALIRVARLVQDTSREDYR